MSSIAEKPGVCGKEGSSFNKSLLTIETILLTDTTYTNKRLKVS
jgi:hypothetical protein